MSNSIAERLSSGRMLSRASSWRVANRSFEPIRGTNKFALSLDELDLALAEFAEHEIAAEAQQLTAKLDKTEAALAEIGENVRSANTAIRSLYMESRELRAERDQLTAALLRSENDRAELLRRNEIAAAGLRDLREQLESSIRPSLWQRVTHWFRS